MQNAIFSTPSDSFLLSHVVHAGPIVELPAEKQKKENTHYFRITTARGAAYCHFKSAESAKRARSVIGTMLETAKTHVFRSRGDIIDITSIVSFSRVVHLKNSTDSDPFAFVVSVDSVNDKNSSIWLTFKSEESAQNARKALYATIQSCYPPLQETTSHNEKPSEVEAEVAYAEV